MERIQTEATELRALFDLQWTRMQEAIALWRAEVPAERELLMPDLGALLTWLMHRASQPQQGEGRQDYS